MNTSVYLQKSECINMAIYPGHRKGATEIFVCDTCGARKRLPANQRHWCAECTRGSPIEMRRAADKWRKIQPLDRPSQ